LSVSSSRAVFDLVDIAVLSSVGVTVVVAGVIAALDDADSRAGEVAVVAGIVLVV